MKSTLSLILLTGILYLGCTKPVYRATTSDHFFRVFTSSGSSINVANINCKSSSDSIHFGFEGHAPIGGLQMDLNHYTSTLGTFTIDNANKLMLCNFNSFHGNALEAHCIITCITITTDFTV